MRSRPAPTPRSAQSISYLGVHLTLSSCHPLHPSSRRSVNLLYTLSISPLSCPAVILYCIFLCIVYTPLLEVKFNRSSSTPSGKTNLACSLGPFICRENLKNQPGPIQTDQNGFANFLVFVNIFNHVSAKSLTTWTRNFFFR